MSEGIFACRVVNMADSSDFSSLIRFKLSLHIIDFGGFWFLDTVE